VHRTKGPRVHGDFFQHLVVDVELQTETRVRVKVGVSREGDCVGPSIIIIPVVQDTRIKACRQ
jgi:hypothetical protein